MNDASKLAIGQAHYSAMLYPEGTFVDDVIVHRLGEDDFLLVINAGTREKDISWVRENTEGLRLRGRGPERRVHAAGDSGPAGDRRDAQADGRESGRHQELLVHARNGLRTERHPDRAHRLHRRRWF